MHATTCSRLFTSAASALGKVNLSSALAIDRGVPAIDSQRHAAAGKTFSKPCKLAVTEKPNSYGRYWTWVHWELEVRTMDFVKCEEVLCRAWDWSQNTQPAHITWTLLGQGNYSMFRVKAHKETDEQVCVLLGE